MALIKTFYKLPLWAKCAVCLSPILLIDSIFSAWGEERFIVGVVETFAAAVLYYGFMFGGIFVAFWVGNKIFERTRKTWLAWAVGLTTLFGIWLVTSPISDIPGIGWRYERMMEYSSYDY